MKLFKSILAVMMMAVTLNLASCSSDNDGPDGDDSLKSKIVGTWVRYCNQMEELDYDDVMKFDSNGRFANTEKGLDWEYGTYTISGDMLHMQYDSEDYDNEYAYQQTYKIVSITSSKMELREYYGFGDDYENDEYGYGQIRTWYKQDK